MKVLQQLLNFYINSSIHVALAVYALAYITVLEFELEYDESTLYFLFYSTITGYNFVKYFGLAKFHHRSLAKWLKAIQVFSLLSFLLMGYYALQLSHCAILILVVLGATTFFYAIPFLPRHLFVDKQQNLRSIGGLKIYIIAFVWTGATVALPLANTDIKYEWSVTAILLYAVQRFVFIIALMLPFEIRDLKFDSLKLSTIPQKIGIKKTKLIGILLSIVCVLVTPFIHRTDVCEKLLTIVIIMLIYTLLLLNAKSNQSKYYSAFWVEGIPAIWLFTLVYLS
jgi:hypothetical protein